MNKLEVQDLGKKFFRKWVFRNLNFEADSRQTLLLKGSNGSGKSTLLRILSGQLAPNEGKIKLTVQGRSVSIEQWYKYVSWTGPYLELFPDLSLLEMTHLHFRFKDCLLKEPKEILSRIGLEAAYDKPIKFLSSGMLARFKNALALFSRSEILLLDEPTGNLDTENVNLLFNWLDEFGKDRIIIFASNDTRDFSRFQNEIDLSKIACMPN